MEWTDGSGEPNWLETERECTVDQEANVCRGTCHMTDYSSDDTDKAPPLQAHTLREFEQHLNDLKKENFSLKLRIYFLEERIQQKYDNNSDDVYRTNIELKVEVESLKQELQEKQQLLDKALTTAESLTNHNEAELQRRCEERQREIDHMQQVLQTKIQLLQEEAQLARSEAERMATLAESCSQHSSVTMETITKEMPVAKSSQSSSLLPDTNRDRERVEELEAAVRCKERVIRELTEERSSLRERVTEMEEQLQDLAASLLQKERDAEFYQEELGRERLRVQQEMENLIEDQQNQLNQYECAAGQCVSELQTAQLQVQSLQSKIQESETSNKKLQERLNEMETELQSIRQATQSQERTIQSLTESLTTKETEAQELYQVIEDQNNTLCKLREMAHRNQLQNTHVFEGGETGSVSQLQSEVVGLQSSLFCCQLELEASRRAQRRSQREAGDLARARDRLCADLDAELQHRETTDKHNQDLRNTVQQLRSELQVKEAQLRESESEQHCEISARDKTISELQLTLRDKERLLQEYFELLEHPADAGRSRDALLDKLKSRIRERDKALEHSIDEKFRCVEEKEGEVRRLQLALREKERDLERLRCILSNNEETITSLDTLVRSKELEAEQMQEACRKLQGLKEQCDKNYTVALREKDNIIKQLHATLNTRSKEAEDLTAALVAKSSPSAGGLVEDLCSRLAHKERLFKELLADRSRQSQEHHIQIQDLLSTISSRDQYIKESGERLRQVIAERAGQLQEVRTQLSSREQELSEVRRERERERDRADPLATEMERLQSILKEKEKLIQDLMQSQEEAIGTSRLAAPLQGLEENSSELQAVKEELQIALRKQKEAELELSELRPALLRKHEEHPGTEYQSTLEQLTSEYQQLNQALRAEKKLYQNLSQIQCGGDSAEKTRALHMELDTVQALRGQLEEVLGRTRDTTLALDRAAKAQASYGGGPQLRSGCTWRKASGPAGGGVSNYV